MGFRSCRWRDPSGTISPIARPCFCQLHRPTIFRWQLFRWNHPWHRGNRPSRRSIWRISKQWRICVSVFGRLSRRVCFESPQRLRTCHFGSLMSTLGLVLAAAKSAGNTLASPLQTFTCSAALAFCSSVTAWKSVFEPSYLWMKNEWWSRMIVTHLHGNSNDGNNGDNNEQFHFCKNCVLVKFRLNVENWKWNYQVWLLISNWILRCRQRSIYTGNCVRANLFKFVYQHTHTDTRGAFNGAFQINY